MTKTIDNSKFQALIKLAKLGNPVADLARKTSKSESTFSRYLNNLTPIKDDYVQELCKLLNVKYSDVVEEAIKESTPKPESLEVDWRSLYLKEVEETKRLNKQRDEIFATAAALKEIHSTLSRKILVVQEFAWEIGAKLGLGQEALDVALDTIEGEVHSVRRRKGKSFDGDMKHKSGKKAQPEKRG